MVLLLLPAILTIHSPSPVFISTWHNYLQIQTWCQVINSGLYTWDVGTNYYNILAWEKNVVTAQLNFNLSWEIPGY